MKNCTEFYFAHLCLVCDVVPATKHAWLVCNITFYLIFCTLCTQRAITSRSRSRAILIFFLVMVLLFFLYFALFAAAKISFMFLYIQYSVFVFIKVFLFNQVCLSASFKFVSLYKYESFFLVVFPLFKKQQAHSLVKTAEISEKELIKTKPNLKIINKINSIINKKKLFSYHARYGTKKVS